MTKSKLPHLIKLLDDDDPIVQAAVRAELWKTDGDVSHELQELGLQLSMTEVRDLSKAIAPARRARLERDWVIPDSALNTPDGDWDTFEAILQMISDFLHDGVHPRSLLSDLIDDLAKEIEDQYPSPEVRDVIKELFESGRFEGNRTDYYNAFNSDLVWSINNGKSNPIGLVIIFMLVSNRLGLDVYGCNLPGHFLAQTVIDSQPILIDAFTKGRQISVEELLSNPKKLSEIARNAIKSPASLGMVLQRVLTNLKVSLEKIAHQEDVALVDKLIQSLNGHV